MDHYEDPEYIFGKDIDKPYHKETIDEIIRHRKEFGDQLFIDRLLTTLGVDKGEIIAVSRAEPLSWIFYANINHR